MANLDLSNLSPAELDEVIAQAKAMKKGALSPQARESIEHMARSIKEQAANSNMSVAKYFAAVAKLVDGSGTTRKISRRVELQRILKAAGKPATPQVQTEELERLVAAL